MKSFQEIFATNFEVTADASGRVNLIGEHTDYNGGFVLPVAIPQRTQIELRRRSDLRVYLYSEAKPEDGICSYVLGQEKPGKNWVDYIQGLTAVLRKRQQSIAGFEARIESNVPIGSGVSSSAALEVSILRALQKAFDLKIDDKTLALIAHSAENEFVGARVGIMDQMVASVGSENEALFLDTQTLDYRKIPLPEDLRLAVLDSGISHQIREGRYNSRREECEEAAKLLGVPQLRDIEMEDLSRLEKLPGPLKRRVRHVVSENQRVLQSVRALEEQNLLVLGTYLNESHRSLKDDFEVSVPEIDKFVQLAQGMSGVFGARMTGGGFGGSIIVAARSAAVALIAEQLCTEYFAKTGLQARVLLPE